MPPYYSSAPPSSIQNWSMPQQSYNPLTNQWYYNSQFNPSMYPYASNNPAYLPVSSSDNVDKGVEETVSSNEPKRISQTRTSASSKDKKKGKKTRDSSYT